MGKISRVLEYAKILLDNIGGVKNNLAEWSNSLKDPAGYYLDAFRYYYFHLPVAARKHKSYFSQHSRGFGEKAFHTMWFLLYKKFQFNNFLEIGIYRGQTMSLMALLAMLNNKNIDIHGISPFTRAGDEVSRYIEINYQADVIANFDHFSLPHPHLLKAYSTEDAAVELIRSRKWDCVYIDGSHDYEIARQDWENCRQQMNTGGIIVMDDASLYIQYTPAFFAFKGHPGPSKVAEEISNDDSFKEILRVGHNRVFQKL